MSIEPKHTAKNRNSFECCGMALDEPEGEALATRSGDEEDRKAKEEQGVEPHSMAMVKRDEARTRRDWQWLGTELTGVELLWNGAESRGIAAAQM